MSDFKVGDMVRVHKNKSSSSIKHDGEIGTITDIYDNWVHLDIEKDDSGLWFYEISLLSEDKLIKDNMVTDTRVENVEPAILREAQAEALKEIKMDKAAKAKQYFKEQYAKKEKLEEDRAKKQAEIDAINKELAEVLKGLKKKN